MQPNNNQYDFILNPEKQKKAPIDLKANPKMLFGFIGFSLFVIVIIFILLNAVINSGNNSQKNNLTEITKAQTELIRIADLPSKDESATETTKYRALNVKVTTISSQSSISSMLAKRGVKKVNPKVLASSKDPSVDASLEKATKNNKFNDTYNQILEEKLQQYKILIQKAYDSGNKAEKATLKPIYQNVDALLTTKK